MCTLILIAALAQYPVIAVPDNNRIIIKDGDKTVAVTLRGVEYNANPVSRQFAEDGMLGHRVTLQYDPAGKRDADSHLTAFVFLEDHAMANWILIAEGYALTSSSAASMREEFLRQELRARLRKSGCWLKKDFAGASSLPSEEASQARYSTRVRKAQKRATQDYQRYVGGIQAWNAAVATSNYAAWANPPVHVRLWVPAYGGGGYR